MNKLGLGYEHLNKNEQYAYEIFEEAFQQRAASCNISKVARNVDMMKVLTTVLGDNPKIIYFNKTMIRTMGSFFGGPKQLDFTGCMSARQAQECEKQLAQALEEAVWEIDAKARNDREILYGISEYLQRNVKYNMDELKYTQRRGTSKFPITHNAYGALVDHNAVCDGFASAYALIAQYFGFRCMVVEGQSSYETSSKVDHAWNIIEYEGAYFHIDATWDANMYASTEQYSYNYFGLDDDEVSIDHDWDFGTTPTCNSDKLSYYKRNGLYAYSESQIVELIYKHFKRDVRSFSIKLSPAIAVSGNAQKYVERKIMEAAERAYMTEQFRYLWQDTTRCLTVIW